MIRALSQLGSRARALLSGRVLKPPAPHAFALLRRRLIITNLMATVFVLLVISSAIYFFEAHVELAQIDRQIASEADGHNHSGLPAPNAAPDQGESPYNPRSASLFSVVVSPDGKVAQDDDQVQAQGLPDLALARPVLSGASPSTVSTAQRGGVPFRLYTVPIRQDGRIVGAVQSGMSLLSYQQALGDLMRVLIMLDLLIALLILVSSIYLTERAMKPARAAFERQRQFAAGASHELRTPLALIRSLAELLAEHRCAPASVEAPSASSQPSATSLTEGYSQVDAPDAVADDAREIIHEVDYMTRLVTDLLLLARDERDRRALSWATVDIGHIVREVVTKTQTLAVARNVTLTSELDARAGAPSGALIAGDADRLRELALILIENAVHYTPAGGEVHVALRVARGAKMRGERGHVSLSVRDTGPGIALEDQPHVFEPFYRANSTAMRRASAGGGSGLGLSLAHWIVEAHDGEISLSSAPGAGTTFTVHLPLAAPSHTTQPLDLPSSASSV